MRFDRDQLYAVWDGRFQPFHLGHVAVIKAIVTQFDLPLVVMIIQSSEEAPNTDYTASVNAHHTLDRNPLTLWERYQMVNTVVAAEDLSDRVTVLGIPRPDTYWSIARSSYPQRRFICLTDKDDYERSKAVFWAKLGEETRVVKTEGLPEISGTMVKELIKSDAGWRELLHPSILDYFESIDGPARFCAANL